MAEHIDKNRLNTDLRYRFEYLSKFLDFTRNDIQILNKIFSIIQPLIPIIVDNVYRKLYSLDIIKQYLVLRHSCFNNFTLLAQANLNFNSQGMEYRKNMFSYYLKSILIEQEWNDQFLEYLLYIEKIHTDQTGSAFIHVDYIHLNILCGYLEQNLI